jgi:hypothetical protein
MCRNIAKLFLHAAHGLITDASINRRGNCDL